MKQTAVNFLYEFIQLQLTHEQQMQFEGLFQQAKVMEKEQIENAYRKGHTESSWGRHSNSENYYNETFKSQEQRIIDMMRGDEELGIYKSE